MNYRHIYHAGNISDVFKHIIYSELLLKLREKDKPFCIIETHAGLGLYSFKAEESNKTKEYQKGVLTFLKNAQQDPDFSSYLRVIHSVNGSDEIIRNYPGSPVFGRFFLRKQDKMKLFELHSIDCKILSTLFAKEFRVKVFHGNGYQSLKSCLPPIEKRGLVFIDPPFEDKNEIIKIIDGLKEALKRFSYGIFAIWYPIKIKKNLEDFYNNISQLNLKKFLSEAIYIEFDFYPEHIDERLNGCGMMIINPPWQIEDRLKKILPKLLHYLELEGSFKINKL